MSQVWRYESIKLEWRLIGTIHAFPSTRCGWKEDRFSEKQKWFFLQFINPNLRGESNWAVHIQPKVAFLTSLNIIIFNLSIDSFIKNVYIIIIFILQVGKGKGSSVSVVVTTRPTFVKQLPPNTGAPIDRKQVNFVIVVLVWIKDLRRGVEHCNLQGDEHCFCDWLPADRMLAKIWQTSMKSKSHIIWNKLYLIWLSLASFFKPETLWNSYFEMKIFFRLSSPASWSVHLFAQSLGTKTPAP